MSFSVNLARLDATVSDLERFDASLVAHLSHLDDVVSRLHGAWTGKAADAHSDAHERWKSGAERMEQAVASMRAAAATAHANYQSAVTANTRMWDSVG